MSRVTNTEEVTEEMFLHFTAQDLNECIERYGFAEVWKVLNENSRVKIKDYVGWLHFIS